MDSTKGKNAICTARNYKKLQPFRRRFRGFSKSTLIYDTDKSNRYMHKPDYGLNMLHYSGNKKKIYRLTAVTVLILLMTTLHYTTPREEILLHVIYRDLYFLPIILSGFWFGLRGGVTASIVVTILYLPMVIGKSSGFAGHDLGNQLTIILFNIVGILVGWMRNREAAIQQARTKEHELAAMGKAVACIAHDMKTPLTVIGGLVRQVRRQVPDEEKSAKKLDIALEQTMGLEFLVKDMLAFPDRWCLILSAWI